MLLACQVPDCGYGVVEEHPGAGPTHYLAYLLTHGGLVAVYGATLARGLAVAELATVEPLMGIALQFAELVRDSGLAGLVAAVKLYHAAYGAFLPVDSVAVHLFLVCILCKYNYKRARNMKLASIFFTASADYI